MKIKDKVLKEVYKKYDKKNLLFGERKIFNKAIDLALKYRNAEVGKVIDERSCCFKDIRDYKELKKELGIE